MIGHGTLFRFASMPRFFVEAIHSHGNKILLAVCIGIIFCLSALAEPSDSSTQLDSSNQLTARLSSVEGHVQLLRGTSTEFQQALQNMPLTEGSRLVTGNDGQAEVQFEDGSIARVTPNSSMSLNVLRRNSDGSATTEVELLSGLGYFELHSAGAQAGSQPPDAVRFGTTLLTASSDAVTRINRDTEPADVAVFTGDAHIAGTQFSLDLHASESVRFDESEPSRYYLAQGIASDSWDQWNSDRDQALATAASQESTIAAEQGNPDNPAWSDLDQNGAWYDVPGYGDVWTPADAGPDWDPYGSGYWAFYSGPGYVWVSGYSWGWLPYRCGGWNYFDFGWGWIPGQCRSFGLGPGLVFYGHPRGYAPPIRPTRPVLKNPGARLAPFQRVIAVNVNPGIGGGAHSGPARIANGNVPPKPVIYQGQNLEPISAKFNPDRGRLWGYALHKGDDARGDSQAVGSSGVRPGQQYTIVNGEHQPEGQPRQPAYQPPPWSQPTRPAAPPRPSGSAPTPRPEAPHAPAYSAPHVSVAPSGGKK